MDRKAVLVQLVRKGMRIKDLAGLTHIDYDRLQKVLHEYRPARPEEIRAIAQAVDLPESVVSGSRGRE
jgi:lambda repressor-like predicted transcriptional regulator